MGFSLAGLGEALFSGGAGEGLLGGLFGGGEAAGEGLLGGLGGLFGGGAEAALPAFSPEAFGAFASAAPELAAEEGAMLLPEIAVTGSELGGELAGAGIPFLDSAGYFGAEGLGGLGGAEGLGGLAGAEGLGGFDLASLGGDAALGGMEGAAIPFLDGSTMFGAGAAPSAIDLGGVPLSASDISAGYSYIAPGLDQATMAEIQGAALAQGLDPAQAVAEASGQSVMSSPGGGGDPWSSLAELGLKPGQAFTPADAPAIAGHAGIDATTSASPTGMFGVSSYSNATPEALSSMASVGQNSTGALNAAPAGGNAGVSAATTAGPGVGDSAIDWTSLLKSGKDSLLGTKESTGWLTPLLGAGGLAYALSKGQQDLPSTKALKDQLGVVAQQAQGLTSAGKSAIETSAANAQPLIDAGSKLALSAPEAGKALTAQGQDVITKSQETSKALTQQGQDTITKAGETDALLKALGIDITKTGMAKGGAIQDKGTPLIDQGTDYTKYLAAGTLPPGLQAQVDQKVKDAKTQLASKYASMGLPTDPSKNSQLLQEMQAIDQQGTQMAASLGQQLLQGGTSLIGAGTGVIGAGTGAGSAAGQVGLGLIGAGTSAGNAGSSTGLGLIGAGNSAGASGMSGGLGLIGAGNTATGTQGNLGGGIAGLGTTVAGQGQQLGTSMLGLGTQLTGMDTGILNTLSGIDKSQTEAIGKAIASFAAALGPKTALNLNFGNKTA